MKLTIINVLSISDEHNKHWSKIDGYLNNYFIL